MNINKKIEAILRAKNMSYYQLSKVSNLSASTLSNMRNRGNAPSIYTLEQICAGLGISMSQFFIEKTEKMCPLNDYQQTFITYFILLSPKQQELIFHLVKELASNQKEFPDI